MKLMLASDIHGSAPWCSRLLEHYRTLGAEKLILLGDLLYHGPRNDLPEGYAPKEVIALLNPLKDELLCVRGNCEAEVDQMVLRFPVLNESLALFAFGCFALATHGHVYGDGNPPPLPKGALLFCGHTHVPAFNAHEGYTYVNPGSVGIPKNGTPHSALIWQEDSLAWIDLADGEVFRQAAL